ncbi:hypothetical protein LWE61_18735 [Sphingobium sufflavum]|uniref:Cthe_2314 family HEPN domain-containing protein n=1 Tax=Sphingobium sufflavum TaxID=1129547 RepID=UPI001F3EC3AA|nr:Cthe_2314 family HEPN domain-containing protein [Sphingobium sufflavum]MCE7798572.1 hypothetical protein [Sphingobium sufflavum]
MSDSSAIEDQNEWKPKRRQTRFLARHIVSSDSHGFIGRLYDLGIVSLNFDTYEEVCQFPDCKYAIDSVQWVENLAYRVESLNLAGDLLWPKPVPKSFKEMPVSRYQWLTIAADVFLMRYVSVVDCALLLVNQIYQLNLPPRSCTVQKVLKASISAELACHIRHMFEQQESVRSERNARIHHGFERDFTDDDRTFKTASLFNDKLNGMVGTDIYGRNIDVDLSFREGLVNLQRDFNRHVREIEKQLDRLYDLLSDEFEERFAPLIAAATHGMNARAKQRPPA